MKNFVLDGQTLTMNALNEMVYSEGKFSLSDSASALIKKSRDYIESRIKTGEVMYGVNTGRSEERRVGKEC